MNEWPRNLGCQLEEEEIDMSIGLLQTLPGSRETGGAEMLANEPWLLPITDGAPARETDAADAMSEAVRRAAKPFWLAANGLGLVMALALTLQATTGWMNPTASVASTGPVADATPPTIAVHKASFAAEH